MTVKPDSKRGALLLGGAHGTLAVARSLGRRGIPVFHLTDNHQIPSFSRYTTMSGAWEGPERAMAADDLLEIGRRNDLAGWVLFPGGDAEVRMVAQNRDALAAFFTVPTPGWDTARWALDKKLTYERAASLGIAHPWSLYPRDRRDVAALERPFPLIVKPTIRRGANAFTLSKAWQVSDRAALLARYDQAVALVGTQDIVLQDMIPGGGEAQFSYAAVWDAGEPVASFTARRARQYPIHFGYTSTMVQTVVCKEVEDAAVRLLRSLAFNGLVEVEFKFDSRDGRYKILDVNARPWTWIALGDAAGVDFPYLAWLAAIGEKVAPVSARDGATWLHGSRDLVAAAQEMWAGRLKPADYLPSLRKPFAFAEFAADDPVPALIDLPLQLGRYLTRRLPITARHMMSRLATSRAAPAQGRAPSGKTPPRYTVR